MIKKILSILSLSVITIGSCSLKKVKVQLDEKTVSYKDLTISGKIATEFGLFKTDNCEKTYKLTKVACQEKITEVYVDVLKENSKDSLKTEEKIKWLKDNVVLSKNISFDSKIATALLYYLERMTINYYLKNDTTKSEKTFTKMVRMVFDPKIGNGEKDAIKIFEDIKKKK